MRAAVRHRELGGMEEREWEAIDTTKSGQVLMLAGGTERVIPPTITRLEIGTPCPTTCSRSFCYCQIVGKTSIVTKTRLSRRT